MKLGLGTGSTAVEAVRRIGELVRDGALRDLKVVPTSFQTEVACRELGISLWSLNDPSIAGRLDLTIDGADEVDPAWRLIKGGGAAMLIEKIVAHASRDYAIIVDSSKIVGRLGEKAPVPVELVPEALTTVSRARGGAGRSPGAAHGQDEGRAGDHRPRQLRPGRAFPRRFRPAGHGTRADADPRGHGPRDLHPPGDRPARGLAGRARRAQPKAGAASTPRTV